MPHQKPQDRKHDPHPDPKQDGGDKKSTNRHVYVEPGVQIDFVQDIREKYDAAQEKTTGHSKKILFWTIVSAILLFIYAGVTAYQAFLTRQIIINTTKQFQAEQRPYISIMDINLFDPDLKIHHPTVGRPVFVNVMLKNIGKTSAIHAVIHRHLLFSSHLAELKVEPPDDAVGVVIDPQQIIVVTAISFKDTYSHESIDYNPADAVNWDGKETIIVFGRVSYKDSSGVIYCTPFLSALLQNGLWTYIGSIQESPVHEIKELCPVGNP
jgi:hypothetical protein